MDKHSVTEKALKFLTKYKYAILILIIGIVLMNLPVSSPDNVPQKTDPKAEIEDQSLDKKLEDILKHIEGVGNTRVLLTVNHGPVVHYQEDREESQSEDNLSKRSSTIILEDADRKENGLITREDSEIYRGATVICQGAGNPKVRLSVTEAVSKVTGLSSDKICVLKMN